LNGIFFTNHRGTEITEEEKEEKSSHLIEDRYMNFLQSFWMQLLT